MRLDTAGLRATFTPSSIDFSILFNCFSMNTYNFYDWREKTITTSGGKSGEKDVGGKNFKASDETVQHLHFTDEWTKAKRGSSFSLITQLIRWLVAELEQEDIFTFL